MPIYSDIYNGPPHGYSNTYSKKLYIAIHNTSNDASAYNEASYAKRRTDSVSSHYYADKGTVIQSLNTDYRAWHAGSSIGNSRAIAYEIVGTNSKSRTWWLQNVDWDKLAKCIARDMKHWGIKNQHLSVSQMKAGTVTGIVTHDDMRRAWGGTTHNDPGPNFPMDHLIKKVNQYLNPAPAPVPPKEDNMPSVSEIWGFKDKDPIDGQFYGMKDYLRFAEYNMRQQLDEKVLPRVAELEKKVDRIIAILEAQNKTS